MRVNREFQVFSFKTALRGSREFHLALGFPQVHHVRDRVDRCQAAFEVSNFKPRGSVLECGSLHRFVCGVSRMGRRWTL